jgi:hypothetical protein
MKLNSVLKQKFLRVVVGGLLVAGLLPATNAFAVSAFPASGSCAMLMTQPVPYGQTIPVTNKGFNILAIFNFTSATGGTLSYYGTRVSYTAAGIVMNTAGTGTGVAFTVASSPELSAAGVKTMTFSPPSGGGAVTVNAIAVNGGNTLLIQGNSEPFSGICQF